MDDELFSERVRLLEKGFVELSAAYFFNPYAGGHTIDVFDLFEGADEIDEWVTLRSFALDVQQLVFFAFEHAPDSVVTSWGDDHLDGGGERALARVVLIREVMAEAWSEWRNRFTDLGPTLGDISSSYVYDEDVEEHRTVVRLNSFFAEGLRRLPVASSRQYLSAVLSRRDIRRMIDHLRMADAMYEDDWRENVGEEGEDDTAQ